MQDQLAHLTHISRPLPDGGMVLVLNTGAVIGPEAEAMLQALHSRSTGGIRAHLETLKRKGGAEKFMESFYVGYGHKSIGDCGSATAFIEGVSMLAAKAVQDWPLYSGQEASTRYIDFSKQKFLNPAGSAAGASILEEWRSFYLSSQEPLRTYLAEKYPRQADEPEAVHAKAIRARAFDILRGFLPAGAATNLAWHSNLRQFADKLALLRHHPLDEARWIAEALASALQEAFPSSFGHKRYSTTEAYHAATGASETYFTAPSLTDFAIEHDGIDRALLAKHRASLAARPPKTELPKTLAHCGTVRFAFSLDFGSFRDLQRHRAVIQKMPLLTAAHGFGAWYLAELPAAVRADAETLLETQEARIRALGVSPETAQYYLPMGYELPNEITGTLPALVYLAELRATSAVHPTLSRRALQIGRALEERFAPYGLVVHLENEPGRFTAIRGTHDIVEKTRAQATRP